MALSWGLSACGSSSGGSTPPPPPPPPAAEYLLAAADNTVITFGMNSSNGALTQLSYVPGNHYGYGIVANPAATFLYTDDVTNGGIDAFSIGASGALTAVSGSPFPMPSGWSIYFVDNLAIDPAGKFLYAPDSASNVIAVFTINGSTGVLTPISGSPFAAGQSPQQVVVHSSGKFLYASNGTDTDGSISAFTIDASTGILAPISGSPFPIAVGSGSDGLIIDPSGKFLYATEPLSNCIGAFTIDGTTGVLTAVPGSPFAPDLGGVFPVIYSIALTPSGKYLYALGGDAGTLYTFAVDGSTGALTSTGSPVNRATTYFSGLQVDPSGKFLYVGSEAGGMDTMNIDETTGALSVDAAQTTVAYGPTFAIVTLQ